MTQRSSSVRLPHSVQKRTRSFTSSIAAASASASSFGRESRWNARRCAVRCPTPGSRVSCATRLSTAGETTAELCLPMRLTRPAAPSEAESQRPQVSHLQLRLGQLLRRLERRVDRGEDEILERLHVLRVDRLLRDLDLDELARARGLDRDRSTARGPLDDLVLHLLLRLLHLLLHLLRLLHQLAEVHAHDSSTPLASKVSLTSW